MVTIPRSFSLMNRDYTVTNAAADELQAMDDNCLLGLCDYEDARIIMGRHRLREAFEHTYFHELAHALLEAVGKPRLAKDEALVDALGAALHQYEKTKAGRLAMKKERKANGSKKSNVNASSGERISRLVDRGPVLRSQKRSKL